MDEDFYMTFKMQFQQEANVYSWAKSYEKVYSSF